MKTHRTKPKPAKTPMYIPCVKDMIWGFSIYDDDGDGDGDGSENTTSQ